jgi:hypothetical protein
MVTTRSRAAAVEHNLPEPLTSLVGRGREPGRASRLHRRRRLCRDARRVRRPQRRRDAHARTGRPGAGRARDPRRPYTTTLRRSDLPANPPPELTHGSSTSRLTVARSGGIDNGPAVMIANAELGVLESSNFAVQGATVLLRRENCAAAGNQRFCDNRYRYTVSRGTLRVTTVSNGCKDKVAQTILTSRPWHRTR